MTLKEYLNKNNIAEFAASVGVHLATVYRWIKEDALPSAEHMRAISKATDKQVTPNDFYGI